jgi:hypothetical protein
MNLKRTTENKNKTKQKQTKNKQNKTEQNKQNKTNKKKNLPSQLPAPPPLFRKSTTNKEEQSP